jgi:hypothetical protein
MSIFGKKDDWKKSVKPLENFLVPVAATSPAGEPPKNPNTYYVALHPTGGKRSGGIEDWTAQLLWDNDGDGKEAGHYIYIDTDPAKLSAKKDGLTIYKLKVPPATFLEHVNKVVGIAMNITFLQKAA